MASLFKLGNRWTVDVYRHGRVRLGTNKARAMSIHRHIQKIEESRKFATELDAESKAWVDTMPTELRQRLVGIGFLDDGRGRTIGDLVELGRKEKIHNHRTRQNRENAFKSLLAFVDASKPVVEFKRSDALQFKSWMLAEGRLRTTEVAPIGLSPATVAKRIRRAKSLFGLAVENGWIEKNPFDKVKGGSMTNPKRSFFVDPEMTIKVIEEIDNREALLAFVLARYAGFRIPTEAIELQWRNINFELGSMTFRTKKTEHISGREFRTCPIFPELRPYLLDASKQRTSEWVMPKARELKNPRQILAKPIEAAIVAAGVDRWPKLFQNLRATRATEVANEYGVKAESEWIGHGIDVSMSHYLMVTEDVWKRASRSEI